MTSQTSRARESADLWALKIVAGGLIIFLLGLHFVVNHLVAPGGLLSWADIVRYYQNPIIPIIEVVFLIAVVTHSLIGTRSIILDLNPTDRVLKIIDIVLWSIGVTAIAYGAWLALKIASFGVS